jgi:hypothetical protein
LNSAVSRPNPQCGPLVMMMFWAPSGFSARVFSKKATVEREEMS